MPSGLRLAALPSHPMKQSPSHATHPYEGRREARARRVEPASSCTSRLQSMGRGQHLKGGRGGGGADEEDGGGRSSALVSFARSFAGAPQGSLYQSTDVAEKDKSRGPASIATIAAEAPSPRLGGRPSSRPGAREPACRLQAIPSLPPRRADTHGPRGPLLGLLLLLLLLFFDPCRLPGLLSPLRK